jgi:dihydrofolate synthase / folylpolyglutamate synthase
MYQYNSPMRHPSQPSVVGRSASELLEELSVPTRLGSRPGLERIRALLDAVGSPQRGLKVLHVGGTSGKGSTATIAARLLGEAGYRVGLHVKPHLESVEERFVVDGQPIASDLLAERARAIAEVARTVQPSWYELTVALALQHFRRENVDLAVVEVGLGGTFDATNVIEASGVILTNVGLDHTEVLGDTVEKIATDKAGIIKPGAPVTSGVLQPSASRIVRERCAAQGAPLWQLGEDVRFAIRDLDAGGTRFDLHLPGADYADLFLAPLGAHQVANAALAVAAVARLADVGLRVEESALRRALRAVRVPGRLEVVGTRPLLVLDGAHNPDKMAALDQALAAIYPHRSIVGVLAFKRGHDLRATLAQIAPRLSRAVLTQFDSLTDYGRGQSVAPGEIAQLWEELGTPAPAIVEADPIRAVQRALAEAGPDDVVCVTGSLYLVGVIRSWARTRS